MNSRFSIAGSMLTMILIEIVPLTTFAAAPLLYSRMKMIAEKEELHDVEPDLARFVIALVKEKYQVTLAEEDISVAVRDHGAFLGRCGRSTSQVMRCEEIQGAIAKVVPREERVRKLGRDLYLTSSSYEIPLSEHMGKFAALAPIIGSLLTIWQSGSDRASGTDPYVHMSAGALPEPESTTRQKYDDLKEELDTLVKGSGTKEDLSELSAAVARYRFGYKSVRAEESCGSTGSGGELGLLWKRWCNVEDDLHGIWQHLEDSFDDRPIPVSRDELVLFPTWLYKDINVVVWVTNRNAGIDWEIPLEPVLPRMLDDRDYQQCMEGTLGESYCGSVYPPMIILGGASLAPPQTTASGAGLCNMPVGSQGYLCRMIEQSECRVFSDGPAPTGIRLSECKQPVLKTPMKMSISGPDVCGIGGWRLPTENPSQGDTPVKDNIPPTQCSNCSVDLYCATSCPGTNPAVAFTGAKQSNGVIPICIPNSIAGSTAILQSVIIHELTHAQQTCSNPHSILNQDLNHCCSAEYQAHLVSCSTFFEDGILQDVQIQYQGKNLPVSTEFCAENLAAASCSALGECNDSPIVASLFLQKLVEATNRSQSRLGLPTSCTDAINKLDPRGKTIVASLPSICTPQCRSEYENSIGNNLCFVGQCIEQSWEEERLVPGRMSLNVGDESFPWDSCVGTEPAANTDPPSAGRLVLPTLALPPLPEYNPWAAAQITDRALCQMLGLPPRTPPTLCMGEVSTQLGRPLSDPLDMLVNLSKSIDAQIDPAHELERMAPSVGTRYATNLYRFQIDSLRWSFVEIFDAAATLLEEIGSTSFPQQMCSRVDRACPFIPSNSAAN